MKSIFISLKQKPTDKSSLIHYYKWTCIKTQSHTFIGMLVISPIYDLKCVFILCTLFLAQSLKKCLNFQNGRSLCYSLTHWKTQLDLVHADTMTQSKSLDSTTEGIVTSKRSSKKDQADKWNLSSILCDSSTKIHEHTNVHDQRGYTNPTAHSFSIICLVQLFHMPVPRVYSL